MSDSECLQNILAGARELPPEQRVAYLDAACRGDAAIRVEVESLLKSHDEAGRFLADPTADVHPGSGSAEVVRSASPTSSSLPTIAADTVASPVREGPGTLIGPYKILQQIGEGGFGSVFLAEQDKPVRRRVALKVIKLGMDTKQVVARFEQERQALAMMDHPNIAKVFDAGATATGRPFFVMELCTGDPIAAFCDKNNLSIEERLELFAQVCTAVQHAHSKGIIHRDIKPNNVLVATQDGRPSAKVIDFGIAKATASKLTEKTLFTEHKQLIGTPEYMSPEQAEGSMDIDTRTDVYSLGVLLYELLTGSTPFTSKELRSAAFGEIQRIIREVEPLKPSTRLSQNTDTIANVAAHRRTEPRKLGNIVRGELDWIVMKALEKDRSRRYETANGLAMDIRRYLAGEAVVAAPPSTAYRFKKFIRRNRVMVTAGGAVAAALLIGVIAFAWQAKVARDQRDIAVQAQIAEAAQRQAAEASKEEETKARKRAETISAFVTTALKASDAQNSGIAGGPGGLTGPGGAPAGGAVGAGPDMTILAAMDNAIADISSGRFKDDPETDAGLRETIGVILRNNGKFDKAEPLLEQALAIRERIFKVDDPILAESLNSVAELYQAQGHHAQAEPLYTRALAIREKALGKDHPSVAESLNSLASCHEARGQYALAEPLCTRALAIREKAIGKDDPSVAESLNSLAAIYFAQGKYAEAEPLFVRSLAIREKALGPEHFDVAKSLKGLVTLYQAQGKYALAETLSERALAIIEKALAPDHPIVASNLNNLALLYKNVGKYALAEPLLTRALAINEKALGPNHPNVALSLSSLATLYQAQGKYAQAEPLFTRALAIVEEALGPNHPNVGNCLNNLAALYLAQHEYAQAEPFFTRALAISEKVLGPDHPNTAGFLGNLGSTHQGLGQTLEARTDFDRALSILRRGSPNGSPLLARLLWRSASARLENKDAATALPELEEAVTMAEKLLPPEHPQLKEYREMLAKCKAALAEQGKPDAKGGGG
jgi:serine/threonine protein kinase/tetratricopeptide (TPR) repeat protein